MVDNAVAGGMVPGAIAAIGSGTAAAVYVRAGTIAFDNSRPVDEDTLWRLFSMTKPVTGMATMLLIAEGKLKLDQAVADFIPGFANVRVLTDPEKSLDSRPAAQTITVRHLLTHTAGLGYPFTITGPLVEGYKRLSNGRSQGQPGASGVASNAPNLEEYAAQVASLPLMSEPGTKWRYSIGLDVLGRVIEVASAMPFELFLQQRFFDPLGMSSTYFQVPERDKGRLSTSYLTRDDVAIATDSGQSSVYLQKPSFPSGGGGLVSSARDYDRFLTMLLNRGTLGSVRVMPAQAVLLGMSNLLPAGTDMSAFLWWPDPARIGLGPDSAGSGFGAGARVAIDGPDKGNYSWSGAASTNMFVNISRNLRCAAYVNSPSEYFIFGTQINRSMSKDATA
jgi:CubicO group peptidase (beta-lactamase class C family)